MIAEKRIKDDYRRLLLADLLPLRLRAALCGAARRLRLAADLFLAAAFSAAFLFRVRAAFLAAALRLALDVAIIFKNGSSYALYGTSHDFLCC